MNTCADGLGLLHAILAAPDDDVPRLIYADWLDDEGEAERAEFIRVQVEIAGLIAPKHPGVIVCEGKGPPARAGSRARCRCRPCVLLRREPDLLAAHSLKWLDRSAAALESETSGVACVYRRGFVECVRTTLDRWLEHGPAVVRAHPVVRVEISDKRPLSFGVPKLGPLRGDIRFWATAAAALEQAHVLPASLRPMPGCYWRDLGPAPAHDTQGHYYAWEPLALDALSDACLAWAKLPDDRRP